MSAKKRGKPAVWSKVAGRRATATEPTSRVRVYERPDLPGIFMTCAWDTTGSGRPREIRLPDGITREGAEALADITAAKRRGLVLAGRDSFGESKDVTLGELTDRYHASADASEWSEKHRGDMERARDFWLHDLGKTAVVVRFTREKVEGAARAARNRAKWGIRTERKLLAYIRQLTRWGCDQAMLYDAYPLRRLSMPDYEPEVEELVYSVEETHRLLGDAPGSDWRDILAIHVAADTGRRISAILALRSEDIRTDGEAVFLHFRKQYDKGKRGAFVPISERTAELLARALETDLVQEWGWLFPEGRLDLDDPRDKPRSKDTAIEGLRLVEKVVGVESVPRRAFHGIKRSHVTAAMEASSGDTALVGDVTGNLSAELLRRVYRRSNRGRSKAHVEEVRRRLEGREETREDTRPEGEETGDAEQA